VPSGAAFFIAAGGREARGSFKAERTEQNTSGGYVAESFDQFDLYEPGDRVQRALVLARQAAAGFGIPDLATRQHLDERTLRNQLDRRKRDDKGAGSTWKLSEDTLLTLLMDETHVGRTFRERMLALCREKIADEGDIAPEQFIRDVTVMALKGDFGNAGRELVVSLERRVRKKRDDWEQLARDAGWTPPGEHR
jgi:hypothetical protein